MTGYRYLARKKVILVSFLLLCWLVLASCGKNTPAGQSSLSNQGQPARNRGKPAIGTLQKAVVSPNGHFESLLAANGLTYIGSDNGNVYAMQANDGQMRWHYNTGNPVYLFATANETIYAEGGANGDTIYALNALTGTLTWKQQLDSGIFGDVLSNGVVYTNTNGSGNQGSSVYALNATTGAQIWRYTGQVDIPQPLMVADGVVYFIPSDMYSTQTSLVALRASDGAQLWQFPLSSPPVQAPFEAHGVVYTAGDDGSIYALKVSNGSILWHFKGTSSTNSFTIDSDTLYAVTASTLVYAIRLSDGNLLWQQDTPITFDATSTSAPIVENSVVYVERNDGNISALRASDGTVLWHQAHDRSIFPPFTATGGTIYVNTQANMLYALNSANGSLLWQYSTDTYRTWSLMYLSVIVADNTVFAGTEDGVVQALNSSSGKLLWRYKIQENAVLQAPVYSADLTFKSSVSYATILRTLTDLGLQPTLACSGEAWTPLNIEADFSGQILITSTTAAMPLWLDHLQADPDITQIQTNPVSSCPMIPTKQTDQPGFLSSRQAGTYVGLTFASGTSYDTALNTITAQGFRLASPCYETQLAQGKKPTWKSIGQEATFAESHTLLVATTPSNSTNWLPQIQSAGGVVKVAVSPTIEC